MFTGIIRYSGQIINIIEDQIKGLDSDRSTNNKIDIKLEIVILISKVNNKLNYLVVGEKPTNSKIKKAKELNIKMLTQVEWIKMLDKTS